MSSRFQYRSQQKEIMDDLLCHGEVVDQTLRELEFINRWLGGNAVTMEGVRQLAEGHSALTIADLGCGSGDMLKIVAIWGRENGISLSLTGIDANAHIIAFAKNNCRNYQEINFETLDIFSPEFHNRKYDIILGTLFYHHFQYDALVDIFSNLKQQVRIGFVINDIHRHWLAFHSIRFLTKLFSRSAMVKFDAPLSVLRAFTKAELINVLRKSGIEDYTLRWKWAFRWQVISHIP